MATYIALLNFTEKGAKAVRDTVKRADSFRKAGKKAGVIVKDVHWTLGAYDGVVVYEAPDDETMTAFLLAVAEAGFVRTHTLRAFAEPEMKKIIEKMP
jgi:uncharacterized protein with GYD domain